MKLSQIKLLNDNLSINLNDSQVNFFNQYIMFFSEYNAHTNLISKNDLEFLFEKHIYDSLSLSLFIKKYSINNILDIGTGGGFPALPLALTYPNLDIIALDSIQKKLNFINFVINELNLKNIKTLWKRVELLEDIYYSSFDCVTSRALGSLTLLLDYAYPYIKKNGYFVAYKSKLANTEIEEAKKSKNYKNYTLIETIDYKLPLDCNYDRKLLVFKKIK